MRCPTCQEAFAEGLLFCPRDGAVLVADALRSSGRPASGGVGMLAETAAPTAFKSIGSASLKEEPRADPRALVGTLFAGQYEIQEDIGSGGMGTVYRARQLTVDRDVAVKIVRRDLATDRDVVKRFENEATIVSQLRHPNTLRLYDCRRTDEGDLFIVTEFLRGEALSRILHRGPVPIERALAILDQVCGSLSEAHSVGIVHRDIKPENIFLDHVAGEDVVKVLDFGIAKLLSAAPLLTGTGRIVGTPAYMSPEQALGESVDHRTDIYSLGVVAYHMLTGALPFQGDSPMSVLFKHVHEAPPPFLTKGRMDRAPDSVERLVLSMLEKRREDRPQSMADVRSSLLGLSSRPNLRTSSFSRPPAPRDSSAAVEDGGSREDREGEGRPASAPSMFTTDAKQLPTDVLLSSALPRRRVGQRLIIALVAAIACGGALLFLALRSTKSPDVESIPLATSPSVAPAASKTPEGGPPPPVTPEVSSAPVPPATATPKDTPEAGAPSTSPPIPPKADAQRGTKSPPTKRPSKASVKKSEAKLRRVFIE